MECPSGTEWMAGMNIQIEIGTAIEIERHANGPINQERRTMNNELGTQTDLHQ